MSIGRSPEMGEGFDSPLPKSLVVLWTCGPFSDQVLHLSLEADAAAKQIPVVPRGLRDGDVLVYMSGRLHVVDHRVPQTFDVDLTALDAKHAAKHTTP